MMKILHSADWHLDAPLLGHTPEQTRFLKEALLSLPDKLAALALSEGCDLVLLSGDLFDGRHSPESLAAVQRAFSRLPLPVCISPGNHDPYTPGSPWTQPGWSKNVHIFTAGVESIAFPQLDCRVYGAAFRSSDSRPLLAGFRADCTERWAIGVFHGDPTSPSSDKNAVSHGQVQESGLDYLALGHIHKGDAFTAGETLCAWPGCPMGRGFDETGEKGALIVTLEGKPEARFIPLDVPRFYWLKAAPDTLSSLLPAANSPHFYRVDLVGECEAPALDALYAAYSHLPNLTLRDQTVPPLELWANAGSDTLEGVYFQMLRDAPEDPELIRLAARISRQLLSGREVTLP